MTTLIQRSLAAGELAPALHARVDTVKYQTGVKALRNNLVMRHGGSQSRPGKEFIAELSDSSKTARLIPFVFNADQTYMLEFGDEYMRVIKDGVQVTDLDLTITGVTNANPAVVTYTGTDPSNGDEVAISGIVGAIGDYLNGRNFKVADVNAGSNTFELQYMDGTDVDSTAFGSYGSGGTASRVYEIATPYLEADLPSLQYIQSADVITIAHSSYAPRELSRTGDAAWTLEEITFEPSIGRSISGSVTGPAGAETYRFRVTAIDEVTGEEGLPGTQQIAGGVSSITQANPPVVTYVGADLLENGDEIIIGEDEITGLIGMRELLGNIYYVANLNAAANTFELHSPYGTPVDGSGFSAYTLGAEILKTYIRGSSLAVPTPTAPLTLGWAAVSGAKEYNIYQEKNGVFGFIGIANVSFGYQIIGIDPDTSDTPPPVFPRNPFDAAGNYPSCVTYVQQRLAFANSVNSPEKVWTSRIGYFKNFTNSSPIQDDDAITFTMAGRQVNRVQHLIDLGKMLVLTTAGEWSVEGNAAGVITPTDLNPKQYSYNGSSILPPIIAGGNALYVQARGSVVRDLGFDYQIDGYRGNDLTNFSAHLFDKYTLADWTYQQIPHSIVWIVRSDGVLLGLTYVREHQIVAWHRHDTDGTYENVCSIPEGNEDAVYCVVKRTINGQTKRYIERFASRKVVDIVDSIFMDSALTYDGRNTDSNHTMTLSGGTNWVYTETLTLTSSTSFFASTDVGKEVHLTGSDGTLIKFVIDAYSSATEVTGRPYNRTVPAAMRSAAISDWGLAVKTVRGLWHIEGKDVSVLGDGFVDASPNNPNYDILTVTNGSITLSEARVVIHAGLPYLSDIETLNIDTANGETITDKKKLVGAVTLHVEETRGVWTGPKPPSDDSVNPLENLVEMQRRDNEGVDEPIALISGTMEVPILSDWNNNGRVFIRQVDPIPMSVLAIAPAGMYPFRG